MGRALLASLLLWGGLSLPWDAEAGLRLCGSTPARSAAQEDRLLRLAAAVREQLQNGPDEVVLVARSGLQLDRFGLRYSHAGWALRSGADLPWSVRQLYFDCQQGQARLFDQGLAGFGQGVDDADHARLLVLSLPPDAQRRLVAPLQDKRQALALLSGRYTANAHAWSLGTQNCNQWAVEILAWSQMVMPSDGQLASRAPTQEWLRRQAYQPSRVHAGPWWGASLLSPWLSDDEHPALDPTDPVYVVSTPHSLEGYIRQQWPETRRTEWCLYGKRLIRREGWTPLDAQCQPNAQDEVRDL